MKEENLLYGENVIEEEIVIDGKVVVEVEDKELAAKKLRRKIVARRSVFAVILLVLAAMLVYNYSPSFDSTVTHFSDDAPRVGNNIYGYIDMPEDFTMIGSFDPDNANYAGGGDGVAEGIQLKNEDGTMYIILSLVTADRKREDYVGFGEDRYCLYAKKNFFHDGFDVFGSMTEDLIRHSILETEKDGLASVGTSLYIRGLQGVIVEWKGQLSGEEYQYRTFVIENPENKGVFHCVTAAYTMGNEACVDYARTFSLFPDK